MREASRSLPGAIVGVWVVIGVLALPVGGLPGLASFGDKPLYWTGILAGAGCCVAAARREPVNRRAWSLIALGALAWVAGDVYYAWGPQPPPVPSPADIGYICFYPLTGIGVVTLMRSGPRSSPTSVWGRRAQIIRGIDGAAAALALNAAAAALVIDRIDLAFDSQPATTVMTLCYPVLTALLLATFVANLALREWTARPRWWILFGAVVAFWISDAGFAATVAGGTYYPGSIVDAGWLAAFAAFGIAASVTDRPPLPKPRRRRQVLVPFAFSALAFIVLLLTTVLALNWIAVTLAALALAAVLVRLALTLVDNELLISNARQEARTDALTGLANRRALLDDLETVCSDASPSVLALYDLDGFKAFNDSFGHPAGDSLLARLGGRLRAAAGPQGRAYRLGGDEYCVLLMAGPHSTALLDQVTASLAEIGPGYHVTGSGGHVAIPGEAAEPGAALQLADQRMYAAKAERKRAAASTGVDGSVSSRVPK